MSSRLPAALSLAGVAALYAAQTPAPNTLTPAEQQQGWRLLFDGKSLAGWKAYNSALDPAKSWTVDNGCLKNGKGGGGPNSGGGDIITVDRFTDFDLRFEWRID